MTKQEIIALQKVYGLDELQNMINTGLVWKMEGSMGRAAMEAIKSGKCFLPEKSTNDYYGNYIPSINEVADDSMGSLSLASAYWELVEDIVMN